MYWPKSHGQGKEGNPTITVIRCFDIPANTARTALPLVLDLAGLYAGILHRLLPLPARSRESFADLVERVAQVTAKQRDIDKLTARLHREKQFNRKVEINSQLRRLIQERDELRRDG